MKIVLVGYRGSGKTTIGKLLAQKLGWRYFSTDDEIVRRMGMSIPEIVEKYGWDKFRDVESEVAKEVGDMEEVVVDTGGGIVLRDINREHLRRNSIVIFLSAPPQVLAERIMHDKNRPPLKEGKSHWEEVEEVLRERLPFYRSIMDIEISTFRHTPHEVCEKIITFLENFKEKER